MLRISAVIFGILSVIIFYVIYHFESYDTSTFSNFFSSLSLSMISFSEHFVSREFFKKPKYSDKLFSSTELSEYDGTKRKEIYLSILGNIFDVTKGQKYYGVGGSYNFFTGKDASRAFVTGELLKNSDNEDLTDLSDLEVKSIHDWLQFYHDNYIYKGKLIGRYYGPDGKPTDYNYKVQGRIEKALIDEGADLEEKKKYPPCNVEWSESTGSRVWCTKKSGGIERNWVGVPRKLYSVGADNPRCACINLQFSESDNTEEETEGVRQKSTVRHGNLEEYKGCNPKSASCFVIE